MSETDAVAGMYNIVQSGAWETADYQLPVEEFISVLTDHDMPDELCIVGLEEILTEETERRERLVSVMRAEMDYLNNQHPLPTVQFVIDGEFQSVGETFEIGIDGEFYSLEPIFGRQIKRRRDGWLVTPFRV
jgi:hypothetical protein